MAPSKKLEAIVALFIPPAGREHVLGDLHERYENPRQYIQDAARTLPLVIFSRIRRTADTQFLLLEALAVLISFVAAAWLLLEGPLFVNEPSGFLRLLAPVAMALVGLLLGDAYADPRKRSSLRCVQAPLLAVALMFLSQAVLAVMSPAWMLPRWVFVAGAAVSLLLLSAGRMLRRQAGDELRAAPSNGGSSNPHDQIVHKAQEFEKKIRWRNLREYAAAILVIAAFGTYIVIFENPAIRLGSSLIIAAAAYVVWHLHRRGAARDLPAAGGFSACLDFYRAELARQRDLLRSVWLWYVAPFIPGFIVLGLGSAQANPDRSGSFVNAISVALVVLVIVWLNRHGARKLQREIDGLDALEKRVSRE